MYVYNDYMSVQNFALKFQAKFKKTAKIIEGYFFAALGVMKYSILKPAILYDIDVSIDD